jgi:hypothetical protein
MTEMDLIERHHTKLKGLGNLSHQISCLGKKGVWITQK